MTQATIHPVDTTLRRLAAGASADEATIRHLERCEDCGARVRWFRSLRAVLVAATPDPCPDAGLLVLRASGQAIEPAERDALERHLTACVDCSAMIERLAYADDEVGVLPRSSWLRQRAQSLLERLRALVAVEMPMRVVFATRSASTASSSPTYGAGMAAYESGRYDEARAQLTRAEAEGDKSSDLAFYLGVCDLRAGDAVAAVARLRRAVRSDTKLGEYRWYLAQALLLSGQAEAAARELKRAAALPGPFRSRARDVGRELATVVAESDGSPR